MTILGILHEAKEGPGSSAVDMHAFRKRARIGFDEAERLLQRMQEAGWVARLKPEAGKRRALGMRATDAGDRWVLLANTEQLKLSDVYRLFVFDAHERGGLAQHVDRAIEQGMNASLSEYFEKAPKQAATAAVAEH
jgi:membrane protein